MPVSNGAPMLGDARVIVALDFPKIELAEKLVNKLSPELCKLKVGKELFTLAGPSFVEKLVQKGFDVFLDLKFHDIPNTVASACSVAADLGVSVSIEVSRSGKGGHAWSCSHRMGISSFSVGFTSSWESSGSESSTTSTSSRPPSSAPSWEAPPRAR